MRQVVAFVLLTLLVVMLSVVVGQVKNAGAGSKQSALTTQGSTNQTQSTTPESGGSGLYTFRLRPGDDLKRGIIAFAQLHNLRAASILTGVGSLRQVHMRLAAADRNGTMPYFFRDRDFFEIVSLVGTVESYEEELPAYGHMHVSLADSLGNVVGGHLMKGCIVYTTAEITLMENFGVRFSRRFDRSTGFKELEISAREPSKSLVTQPEPDKGGVVLYQKVSGTVKKGVDSMRSGMKSVLETLSLHDMREALENGL